MEPKIDTPATSPGDPPLAPAPRGPWYQNELVRWGVGIALGFLVSWLSSHGISPTPIPVPQTNVPAVPAVLVLNVGPSTPSTLNTPPINVTGK